MSLMVICSTLRPQRLVSSCRWPELYLRVSLYIVRASGICSFLFHGVAYHTIQNYDVPLILRKTHVKVTRHTSVSISPLASNPTKNSIQDKHSLLINIARALLRLTSVTVFNFTHPLALSAPLLILSASRFLTPDSPLFSVHP